MPAPRRLRDAAEDMVRDVTLQRRGSRLWTPEEAGIKGTQYGYHPVPQGQPQNGQTVRLGTPNSGTRNLMQSSNGRTYTANPFASQQGSVGPMGAPGPVTGPGSSMTMGPTPGGPSQPPPQIPMGGQQPQTQIPQPVGQQQAMIQAIRGRMGR